MKKTSKILSLIAVIVICALLASCAKESGQSLPKETSSSAESINAAVQTEPEESAGELPEESQSLPFYEETEVTHAYYHAAICGAVIVSQDGSECFVFSKKCEACGNVENIKETRHSTGGTLHSSFMCSKCHTSQQCEIETTEN